jgi:hypothetical protein
MSGMKYFLTTEDAKKYAEYTENTLCVLCVSGLVGKISVTFAVNSLI